MNYSPSPIWQRLCPDPASKIETTVEAALDRVPDKTMVRVFFRADDIAVPGKQFARLLALFGHYRVPLSLAVVPTWLTLPRWQALKNLSRNTSNLWCWHHHGWRHVNHEIKGKKQEFGPGRSPFELKNDLLRSRGRLETLMDGDFYPVFTPPWNRCDLNTLRLLKELGYAAVSRSLGSQPPALEGLPDFQVNVDLHTRKDVNLNLDWKRLFTELSQAVASGLCGIMIHHQRMNDAAFVFLELLLNVLVHSKKIQLLHLKDLTEARF